MPFDPVLGMGKSNLANNSLQKTTISANGSINTIVNTNGRGGLYVTALPAKQLLGKFIVLNFSSNSANLAAAGQTYGIIEVDGQEIYRFAVPTTDSWGYAIQDVIPFEKVLNNSTINLTFSDAVANVAYTLNGTVTIYYVDY